MQTVQTKLKEFWEKLKGFFTKLNKKTRILLAVCLTVVIALVIFAAVQLNRKEYAVLCTGLTVTETSNVVQFLSDNGVTDYRIQNDSILVPADRQVQLQSALVLSGNLNSGFLYESYFEEMGATATTTEEQRIWLVAKQQRMEAIIRTFDGVRDAQVEITPGSTRVWVLDPEATPATAAVKLDLDGNQKLSSEMVSAIRDTVAHSVSGLDISNVSITDNLGNTYSASDSFGEISQASALKLQMEEETSNKVRTQIYRSLSRIYGEDNVEVSVNTTVDMDRKIVETTKYSQPEGSVEGGGLIGTEKWFWEVIRDGTEPAGGTVGTETNSDLSIYVDGIENLNGDEDYAGAQGERQGNLDSVVEQREVLAGTITDIGVAVTINANSTNANTVSVEELRSHVASISGIGSTDPVSRVSVLIAPFDSEEDNQTVVPGLPFTGENAWILYAAIGGLVLFLVLLVLIILLARRNKKKKLAKQQALAMEEEAMLAAEEAAAVAAAAVVPPPTGGADIMEVNTEKSMELRKSIRQFVQNNPEIAAQMVKSWLKGGDDSNG